jgi:hypothetical protein
MFDAFVKAQVQSKHETYKQRLESNSRRVKEGNATNPVQNLIDELFDEGDFKDGTILSSLRTAVTKLCESISKSRFFKYTITLTILLVGVQVGISTNIGANCERHRSEQNLNGNDYNCGDLSLQMRVDTIAQFMFTSEAIVKILAQGHRPLRYFTDKEKGAWNCMDFRRVSRYFHILNLTN